ncbi:PREDICTED: selenocysteine-specific elongation factor-like [Priapulus caudatus]|uniref:Selenocysteine-specific elongation factor-like n=1 Tax=Priapulus caudatus TaxID=37621 RepID=A0ABM1EA44_PRICU|nr:PREDICTED: selenocysteine-specific elongation factor-like [Priapulus caudatus]
MVTPAFNFNVGVLGHIDSGKTSLARALSTVASTASFDKNPQSRERGITLDLGFSCFSVPLPEHLRTTTEEAEEEEEGMMQVTLVDCPGHASLIRTIIGGAQIIDLMLLVVDVTKGVQTQTAECLVLGRVVCRRMLVALNKVDLLPTETRERTVERARRKLRATLRAMGYDDDTAMVAVSARPGGPDAATPAEGVDELVALLRRSAHRPARASTAAAGPFVFAVDHCFAMRGQGTVMTGTVLRGAVATNDVVEIPALGGATRRVKSMQMFRRPVDRAAQGDRVGVCVTQFDPRLLERGLAATPGSLPTLSAAVAFVARIPYYKGRCGTRAKMHVSLGHATVMARVSYFARADAPPDDADPDAFDFSADYLYQDELPDAKSDENGGGGGGESEASVVAAATGRQFALLEFEHPVTCVRDSIVIGSRLDADAHANACRLAFHGRVVAAATDAGYAATLLPRLRVYKEKAREGIAERVADAYTVVGRALFKRESNVNRFVGLKVALSTGEDGVIEGGFGQSGKFKVRIPAGVKPETAALLEGKKKGKGKGKSEVESAAGEKREEVKIVLAFRRYVYDAEKKMVQPK